MGPTNKHFKQRHFSYSVPEDKLARPQGHTEVTPFASVKKLLHLVWTSSQS